MTITKLLVEILGGDIEVESELGQGSTFRVRLMLPSITPSVFDAGEVDHHAASLPISGYEGPRQTVMVVDDDLNHLALAENFLTGLGFVVLSVSSVEMAELMLKDASPDILLLDIDMPERDGWAFAADLRGGKWRSLPIIMISGHANEEGLRPKMALHDAFIAKPYNLDDLLLQIAELLKLKLLLEETPPDYGAAPIVLSRDDRAALISDAEIGHASAIRDRLESLQSGKTQPSALIVRLKEKLDAYDMGGIVRELEEHGDDIS